ncbi:MAG: 4-alpha-glucanotransferase [Clostridiales bacterium]|nr:4-alpha-glucanotransferase [Clostridiales bacterium]
MRESGILLHITSLPQKGGIGTLGKAAYEFIDFLKESGASIWQVLPVGPTGYGESPYQSASTYAGNPLMIDLEKMVEEGLLAQEDLVWLPDTDQTDFDGVRAQKEEILRKSFEKADAGKEMQAFIQENSWVEEYAFFMALKQHFAGQSWQQWPRELRLREEKAMQEWRRKMQSEMQYHIYVQWLFRKQWQEMKNYANARGVKLFGDMPIYVAEDSADAWANPEIFQFDQERRPIRVAGVPPDYFSQDGQLWGNPLYDWDALRKRKYDWWMNRLNAMGELFDLVRVDHFIGFANYYSIPFGAKNARSGQWKLGPRRKFFRRVRRDAKDVHIIAEDLGEVNNRVKRLLRFCGYPGMKVLSFAFGGGEENPHLPKNHGKNAIVYTGTHDNDTVLGWWANADEKTRAHACAVLDMKETDDIAGKMIEAAFASTADRAIVPMQDFLRLDGSARMNTPGTVGGNWGWRMTAPATEEIKNEIRKLNRKYQRGGNN